MGKAAERSITETLDALGVNPDKDIDPEIVAQEVSEEVSRVEEEGGPSLDDLDEDESETVALPPPVLIPSPKPKAKTRVRTTATNKIGKGLADKVPGAEKVQVFKRDKHGKKWFISEYTKADLENHTDFQSFLVEYVLDDHGPGEYVLMGVDAHSREMSLGIVRLMANKKNQQDSPFSFAQELMQIQQRRDEEWLKRMEKQQQQPQQDPLQLLMGVMDLNERVNGKAEAEKKAAAAEQSGGMAAAFQAMASSGDRTMQMMVAMMQAQQAQAQQQMQLLLAAMSKPKEEDPLTKALVMKLLSDEGGLGGNHAPPPPPPPPPQNNTVELITAIAGLMNAMGVGGGGGGGEGGDDFKEFAKALLLKKEEDGLSMKEVVQLLMRDKSTDNSFRTAVDNMAAIMNITKNLNQQSEGGAAAGLFDALAALFSNRDFAGSIAQAIRAKTEPARQQLPATATPQQIAAQRQVMEQRALLAARARQQAQQQQPQSMPPQQQPMVQQAPPSPQQPPQADMGAPPQPRSPVIPQLPANTSDHINALGEAKDDAELIGKLITMLLYFAEFEDWREFTEQVLAVTRDGNKKATLKYLQTFFDGLAHIQLIDPALGKRILAAVSEHFSKIASQLQDLSLHKDERITGEDLLAAGDEDGEG